MMRSGEFVIPYIIHVMFVILFFKVDIYSFGMFLYEMIALSPPIDMTGSGAGAANWKGNVLEGTRPSISMRVRVLF